MFRNKRGRIIVKISYDDELILDSNSDCDLSHQNVSYRKKTFKEIKKNQERAQNFRDTIQPSKRSRHSSPKIPRNNSQNEISSPIPNIDVSNCKEEVSRMESTTRDLSASSESRDMPWLLDGSEYFDMEPAKPKPSSSSDMPESSVNVPHVKQKPPDPNHRSNSNNCDSIGIEMKDSEHSEKDYCTLGWCAIGQVHTGCSCGRVNPCVYCTDGERVLKSKVCQRCRDSWDDILSLG